MFQKQVRWRRPAHSHVGRTPGQPPTPPLVPPAQDVERYSRIAIIAKGPRTCTRAHHPLPSPFPAVRHVCMQMFPKKCGSSLGWHSANKICGGSKGKPLG